MKRVHFILDEAASLGHLEPVDDAVDKYRGYGVRLLFIFQDMAQMKKCFPEGQELNLLANCTQLFFGCNVNTAAEYISSRLGDATIVVESGGTSSGSSWQQTQSAQGSSSSSYSNNSNSNWQMQARRLLKPEEVMTLPPTTAITFTPGVRPICTTLLRYYQEPGLRRGYGWLTRSIAACLTLAASVAIGGAALGTAAMLTIEAEKQLSASVSAASVEPGRGPNHLRNRSRTVRRY